MKVSGSHRLDLPRQAVWNALQDPGVLARSLPGCESLEVTGPDAYTATLTAGVASIKGTYRGKVAMTDKQEPASYKLTAEGAGAPGTVRADAVVRLDEDGGATVITYAADAVIGGMIGGVGQRMIQGVAKKTAGEFFSAIEHDVKFGPTVLPVVTPEGEVVLTAAPEVGEVFRAAPAPVPAAVAAGPRATDLLAAAMVGAAIALVGVLVGRRLARGGGLVGR